MPKLMLPLLARARIRQIVDTALALRDSRGSRVADQAIYDSVRVADVATDESYYDEALAYHLGLLFAHANEPELAAEHFAKSHTAPSSSGDLLFPEHVRLGLELHARQQAAARRGVPSILVSAMPRSGSLSLSRTLAETLDIPVLGISKGRYPDYWIAPCWLASFVGGGAVTHDHFRASDFNLGVLREAGIRDVLVQVRDPRAAAASLIHHQERSFNLPRTSPARAPYEARLIERCLQSYYPWLADWLAVAEGTKGKLRVHWVSFGDLRRDIGGVVRVILDLLRHGPVDAIEVVTAHMVHGTDDAWRDGVSPATERRLWEAMPSQAIDLLGLQR